MEEMTWPTILTAKDFEGWEASVKLSTAHFVSMAQNLVDDMKENADDMGNVRNTSRLSTHPYYYLLQRTWEYFYFLILCAVALEDKNVNPPF